MNESDKIVKHNKKLSIINSLLFIISVFCIACSAYFITSFNKANFQMSNLQSTIDRQQETIKGQIKQLEVDGAAIKAFNESLKSERKRVREYEKQRNDNWEELIQSRQYIKDFCKVQYNEYIEKNRR